MPVLKRWFRGRTCRTGQTRRTGQTGLTLAAAAALTVALILGCSQAVVSSPERLRQDKPGEAREFHLRIPFPGTRPARGRTSAAREVDGALHSTRAAWRASLGRIGIELPKPARAYEWTLRSAVAQILIHRDGPRLQPGSPPGFMS